MGVKKKQNIYFYRRFQLFGLALSSSILPSVAFSPKCTQLYEALTYRSSKSEDNDISLPPLPPFEETTEFDETLDKFTLDKSAPWDNDELNGFASSRPSTTYNSDVVDQLTKQRQQIQDLMHLVQKQTRNMNDSSSQAPRKENFVTPTSKNTLKAMLFIDGTWLYYSLHHRGDACPIAENYGLGWQHSYEVNWKLLPTLIAQEIQNQLTSKGWNSDINSEINVSYPAAVEITRATFFTSYKANTDKNSLRVRMFDQMEDAGYDAIKMETVGKGEKCVDISLAVDMLHYATIPGAMDVCILLTGDKDFIPACLRIRQKGVQMAIVSMKRGCNRALDTTPQMKDFDIIFLDQSISSLIVPKKTMSKRGSSISALEIIKIIYGYLLGEEGMDHYDSKGKHFRRAESRGLGRYLKSYRVGQSNILTEIKNVHGGLRHFITTYNKFFSVRNGDEMAFWVEVNLEVSNIDDIEAEFYRQQEISKSIGSPKDAPRVDLSQKTVVELRDILRNNNLPVSGRKADLIERLNRFYSEERESVNNPQSLDENVIDLIKDYLHASGGSTGSRNVGRYLSANKIDGTSALAYLKNSHGSLASFLVHHAADHFMCEGIDDPQLYKKDGFSITLRNRL